LAPPYRNHDIPSDGEELSTWPGRGQSRHRLKQEEAYQLVDVDTALDKGITRKFITHFVPWLFGLWLLASIDRSNIGNAQIDGLVKDSKLKGNKFNVALTVFNLPHILVDVRLSSQLSFPHPFICSVARHEIKA